MGKITYKSKSVEAKGDRSGSDAKCGLCTQELETADHLFFGCNMVTSIWFKIFKWCKVSSAVPNRIKDHFIQCSGMLRVVNGKGFAITVWICVVWVLWKWRNKIIFEEGKWDSKLIVDELKADSGTGTVSKIASL